MRPGKLLVLAMTFLCAAMPLRLAAGIVDIWALGESDKVLRFQDDHPARNGSLVWDGRTVRLRGLYNEVLAFQVIVVADSNGAPAVEVAVSSPANSDGQRIGGQGTVKYGPDGTIEVFSEHYLHIARPNAECWFWADNSVPEHLTGWFPDALITPDARPGRGGMPLDIPPTRRQVNRRQNTLEVTARQATSNQGFWVDIHLPRNRSFKPGVYKGKVNVYSAGTLAGSLPLEVTLLDGYLPDENHSSVWLFGSVRESAEYFPDLSAREVERMFKHDAHRHRIEFTGGSRVHGESFNPSLMAAYKPWLDGSAFTPEHGYCGPGEGIGEKLFPVGMYGSITNTVMASPDAVRKESDKWVEWFRANAPGTNYFWYLIDEPGERQFPWISERASWVHDNPGPGKELKVFTTRNYTPEIADAIDLWASNKGVDMDALPGVRQHGGDIWFYNGLRPGDGTITLEAEAVDLRVKGWIKYRYGLDTWFLWEGTQWRHNHQGPKGHLHQRLFSEPLTFINWSLRYANGNGIIYYPGRMPYYPREDRGVDHLFGSIRLKNIRRGQQDYELMWLAARKAGPEAVMNIVRRIVPEALADVGRDQPLPWPVRGDSFDMAREKLLDLIVQ